jgi:hypothetical protein
MLAEPHQYFKSFLLGCKPHFVFSSCICQHWQSHIKYLKSFLLGHISSFMFSSCPYPHWQPHIHSYFHYSFHTSIPLFILPFLFVHHNTFSLFSILLRGCVGIILSVFVFDTIAYIVMAHITYDFMLLPHTIQQRLRCSKPAIGDMIVRFQKRLLDSK